MINYRGGLAPPGRARGWGGGGTPGNKSSIVVNTEKKPDWKLLFLLMRGTV